MLRTEFNAEKTEWNGRPGESNLNQSLGQAVLNSLETFGPRVAQICANTGMTRTFGDLRALTINTANSLRYFGCVKEDLICLFTKNTADVAPIIFAALYLGVQVAPLPEFWSRVECESFLKLLKPKLLFCDVDVYEMLRECLEYLNNDAKIFTFDGSTDESIPANTLFESSDAETHLEPVELNAYTHGAYVLRTSGTTGTKIYHQLIQNMSKHLPRGKFCQIYGMTETAGTIAANLSHERNDCVGQLISGCKAKIINDSGDRLGIGETGELCLKFACPILGSLSDNDQEAHYYLDGEGFFMTGDLARFDEDNDLFIVDRKKDVFKCYGYNVAPSQIEEHLNTIDGVKQSCVVPIPDPDVDQHFNCLPASVIVKTTKSKCTEQSIYDWVVNNLCMYTQLRGGVYFVDKLPVNASGKVDRNLVKKMAIDFFEQSRRYT